MRYTALLTLLFLAGCSSTLPPPTLDLQITLPASTAATSTAPSSSVAPITSGLPRAVGMLPPNPYYNPKDFGFSVGSDGAWVSRDLTIQVENGLATEVRTGDGSVRCWDLRFTSSERPDPMQAMQFYYATTHKGLPLGTSRGMEFVMMDKVVGTFSCERTK